MNVLVTAGNTQVQIDRVRSITNIFSGRTGARIALHAYHAGHAVTLLTSHPEVVAPLNNDQALPASGRWAVHGYRTFDELAELLEARVRQDRPDAVIHCAAVSDYRSAGVYRWRSGEAVPELLDRSIGKIKSDEPELWLRLVRTPKLIDAVRRDWGFTGVLVKFKLEVGVTEYDLLAIAEQSRTNSDADLMVANTLEGADAWAYLGPIDGNYERVARPELSARLLEAVVNCREAKTRG
jgi:phosphopantothenate-cysteine ligase/phosphopantothenoylcysteine decarboxylase/phosphopantothenate--cysteine ligase